MSIAEKSFRNSEVIIREGETGFSFFQILEGGVFVYAGFGKDDQIKLATLEEGEYFGEMAILEEYPRSATIIAKGNVRVLEIHESDLKAYLEEDPSRIKNLLTHLSNRVESMTRDYKEAEELLSQLREADEPKKKSLFSKLKKHVDIYQSNKVELPAPSAEPLRSAAEAFSEEGSGELVAYNACNVISLAGETEDSMFVIYEGRVGLYENFGEMNEKLVEELRPISFFGERGLVAEEPRALTAVAETDNTCIEIIRPDDLESIFRNCPVKIEYILRSMSYRLRKLNVDFLDACREITALYNK